MPDYETDPGLPWPGDEQDDTGRCPNCALPLIWVTFAGQREHRCTGAERHAQIGLMQRAVSACLAAGANDEASAIASRIDRLRTPTTARAA